jgi:hypothetical protein
MARREEPTAISGYRKVTRDELVAIVCVIDGMPRGTVESVVQAVLTVGQLAEFAKEGDGLGYAMLIMLGVDALRAEGLPLRSSRRSRRPGALEVMVDVLYWVWRKPDPRARGLRRTAESLGPVYWKAKRAKNVAGLAMLANEANERAFIWIPVRPTPVRGRNL